MKNNEKLLKNLVFDKKIDFFGNKNWFWVKLADVGTALPTEFLDFHEKYKKIRFLTKKSIFFEKKIVFFFFRNSGLKIYQRIAFL